MGAAMRKVSTSILFAFWQECEFQKHLSSITILGTQPFRVESFIIMYRLYIIQAALVLLLRPTWKQCLNLVRAPEKSPHLRHAIPQADQTAPVSSWHLVETSMARLKRSSWMSRSLTRRVRSGLVSSWIEGILEQREETRSRSRSTRLRYVSHSSTPGESAASAKRSLAFSSRFWISLQERATLNISAFRYGYIQLLAHKVNQPHGL